MNLQPARPGLKIGQRVMAGFSGPPTEKNMQPRLGVISGEFSMGAYPVQFQPHGPHWHCHHVVAYGDANGWTDEEYRVERERSYCQTRADDVERERRERYPEARFSMATEPVPEAPTDYDEWRGAEPHPLEPEDVV